MRVRKVRKIYTFSVPETVKKKFEEVCKKKFTSMSQALVNLMLEFIKKEGEE